MRNWCSLDVSKLNELRLKQSINACFRHRHITESNLNLAFIIRFNNLLVGYRVSTFFFNLGVFILIVKDTRRWNLDLQPLLNLIDFSFNIFPLRRTLLPLKLIFTLIFIIFVVSFFVSFLFTILWSWSASFGVCSSPSLRLQLWFHYYI